MQLKIRYEARAKIEGTGDIMHLMREADKKAVEGRLMRAYPGKKIIYLDVQERRVNLEGKDQ